MEIASDDLALFQEFMEFKRLKAQAEENNHRNLKQQSEEGESEKDLSVLANLGVVCFLLSGLYQFIADEKHKEFNIAAFLFLTVFYAWGYGVNKAAFNWIAIATFFWTVIWVIVKMSGGWS